MNKAIIVSVEEYGLSYKVRIPEFHKLRGTVGCTTDDNLPIACVCTLPGVIPHYRIGDVVWVDYENSDIGKPIILGSLLTQQMSNRDTTIMCDTIDSDGVAVLPKDTTIGEVNSDNIAYLKNIQTIVDSIVTDK